MPRSPFIYYVYAYVRKSDGTPYYIGKGRGKRAYAKHPGISIPCDKTKIIFLEKNLSEIGAFAIERRLIAWWGRKDISTGILLNRTDGGEGASGAKLSAHQRNSVADSNRRRVWKDESRKKLSEHNKGKPISENTKKALLEHQKNISVEKKDEISEKLSKALTGRTFSDSHKSALSESAKKRTYSEETRRKLSEAAKRRHARAKAERNDSSKNVDELYQL